MVYYFSATGNTRHLANLLAKEFGDQAVSITSAEAYINPSPRSGGVGGGLEGTESFVLCFPVHGWRVPKIVEEFLNTPTFKTNLSPSPRSGGVGGGLEGVDGLGFYILLTCGDDCGETIKYLRKTTDPLGIKIAGAFSLTMPESYVGLPFMDVDTKEREQEKIRKAEEAIPRIADIIRSGKTGVYEVKEGACAYLKSKVVGGFFHHVLITDKTFRLDEDACISCGKCEKVCPVGNIKDGKWLHNGSCLTCLACYHICPKHAISFNWQTKNKGQYTTLINKH